MFPEPFFDELYLDIFVDSDHEHDKVTRRSITGLFSVVSSTPTILSSKRHTLVQTSTFGAELKVLKNIVDEAVMLRLHPWSMGVKFGKSSPRFVDNMSVVLNSNNPGRSLNKKTVALKNHIMTQ